MLEHSIRLILVWFFSLQEECSDTKYGRIDGSLVVLRHIGEENLVSPDLSIEEVGHDLNSAKQDFTHENLARFFGVTWVSAVVWFIRVYPQGQRKGTLSN